MIDVLSYLHVGKRIAHCDIKPDNILVTDELDLVFADFGNAVIGDIEELLN